MPTIIRPAQSMRRGPVTVWIAESMFLTVLSRLLTKTGRTRLCELASCACAATRAAGKLPAGRCIPTTPGAVPGRPVRGHWELTPSGDRSARPRGPEAPRCPGREDSVEGRGFMKRIIATGAVIAAAAITTAGCGSSNASPGLSPASPVSSAAVGSSPAQQIANKLVGTEDSTTGATVTSATVSDNSIIVCPDSDAGGCGGQNQPLTGMPTVTT